MAVTASTEAFKAGDLDALLAFQADNAVFNTMMPGAPETYSGREAKRAWWEELLAQNFDIKVKILIVEEEAVTTKTRTWIDFTHESGIAPLVATEVYVVQGDKIKSVTWSPTEESVAKLQAAIPPQAMPESGGEVFSTYAAALVLTGLIILGGLSLTLLRRSPQQ